MKKKFQLDLICGKDDLRPAMQYVKINKALAVATDAFVMGIAPTSELFDDSFIKGIPDEGMLIHREDFKKITQADGIEWKSSDVVRLINKKKRDVLIEIEDEQRVGKYPNWEAVIPLEKDRVFETNKIAVNAHHLSRLQKALDLEACKLTFSGMNKAIYVEQNKSEREDKTDAYGIVMPCMIND